MRPSPLLQLPRSDRVGSLCALDVRERHRLSCWLPVRLRSPIRRNLRDRGKRQLGTAGMHESYRLPRRLHVRTRRRMPPGRLLGPWLSDRVSMHVGRGPRTMHRDGRWHAVERRRRPIGRGIAACRRRRQRCTRRHGFRFEHRQRFGRNGGRRHGDGWAVAWAGDACDFPVWRAAQLLR